MRFSFAAIKRILLVPVLLSALLPAMAAEPPCGGNMSLGLRGGYVSRNQSGSAGLYFQYRFTNHFRLAPSVDYLFRHKDKDGLALNLDAQMPYSVSSRGVTLYPLAGLNFTSWSFYDTMSDTNDVTTRKSRFGVNLGAGVEMCLTPTFKLGLEGKWTGIKGYSTAQVTVSIGYVF